MKRILLVGLIIVGAATAVMFAREARQPTAPEQATQGNGALVAAPVAQERERIKVTARGRGIKAARASGDPGWEHDAATQRPIDAPGLIRDSEMFPGKIGLRIGDAIGSSIVAIDSTATGEEGDLFRIHVDRPGEGNGHSGQLLVLGFYSDLDSEAAYTGQAYACKKCGRVTVCGVNPECY